MTTGLRKEDLLATMRCEPGAPLPCKLDWPLRKVRYWGARPGDNRPPGAPRWTDLWGIRWQKESPDPSMQPFPIGHPLEAGIANLDAVPWPDATARERFADLANVRPTSDSLLVGEHPSALYERAWLLAGMQPLLESMADEPARVDELFARIAHFEDAIATRFIELGVEAAWIADDYGMNSGLMFSPAMWRRFVKPHLRRLVARYHDAGALVILHSCGNITPLVKEFLEVGIDVLDPLQPNCNRLEEVRRLTAGRMCLCGGVMSSALLAGDMTRTMIDTQRCVELLGAEGGFIVGPDDEADYPASTREAMLQLVERHRQTTHDGGGTDTS